MSASSREGLSQRVPIKDSSRFTSGRICDPPSRENRAVQNHRAVGSTALPESPTSLSQQLLTAIDQGGTVRQLKAHVAANDLWNSSYPALMESKPWLFQCGVKSAKRQVMRLAHPLAVEAQSNVIRPEHLRAAMSYWLFADQRDELAQGSLVYDEHERSAFWRDRVCRIKKGKGGN